MSTLIIEGGKPLQGTVKISGAKNSALKVIAAALFSNDDVILENIPRIENVLSDLEIVEALGGKVEWIGANKLLINGSSINSWEIPFELGSKHRTAALYAATLVYRFGKARFPIPGGCKIGLRPMNRWIDTWESLGIKVKYDEDYFSLEAKDLHSAAINFKTNTHTGTDNAILFSMFAPGETIITGAAEEPEVDDLIEFVRLLGVDIERTEPRKIKVTGKNNFTGANFRIMNDRNEVATFAVGALVTGGNIVIQGVDRKNLLAFVNVLTNMGAKFEISEDEMRVWKSAENLMPVDVTTAAYPGFMTDWQPLMVLLLTQANGIGKVHDTIYWDRFAYTKDLNRMGAKIELLRPTDVGLDSMVSEDTYDVSTQGEPPTVAEVTGPVKLRGSKLSIPDLRAGATLILAALAAEGRSEVNGFDNVSRGYENFLTKLTDLGAQITQNSE